MSTCPARSPESGAACVLPDSAFAHRAGHEGARVAGTRAVWASTDDDRARWSAEVRCSHCRIWPDHRWCYNCDAWPCVCSPAIPVHPMHSIDVTGTPMIEGCNCAAGSEHRRGDERDRSW